MPDFAEPITRLIDELKHLPGIGQKTAQRLAFHLLRAKIEEALALADAIRNAKANIRECSICNNITDTDPCLYCAGSSRSHKIICVVEEPHNIWAVEKTRNYNGLYHVLGGALAPLEGVGPDQLKLKSLIARLRDGTVEEIILATNPTAEGEATAAYVSKLIKPLGVRVTRIGVGIPVGSDMEYADEITMLKAMEGRRELSVPDKIVVESAASGRKAALFLLLPGFAVFAGTALSFASCREKRGRPDVTLGVFNLGEGVGDSAADSNPEVKRRSSRIVQAVPLVVSGVDALGRPFQERTSTLVINCHGCRYQSKHYVLKNMWVTLEVPNPEQGFEPHMARARVMWIQRPRTVRELFQVGVELETPGNLWGIAFPPPDWFPFPEAGEIPALDTGESRRLTGDWSTTGPARTVTEDNLRTMPLSGDAEQIASHSTGAELPSARMAIAEQTLAREMAHLVAEAKQQLQEAIRESTAQALSEETPPLLAALQKQVQEVAERSVEAATSNAIRGALEQAKQASEAQFQTLREQWNRELDRGVEQASGRAAQRFDDLAWQRNAAFEQQLEGRLQHAMESAEQAADGFTARLAGARENAEKFDQQAGDSAGAIFQQVERRIQSTADQARRQLADLDDTARQLDERIANANAAAQTNWQARLDADVATARDGWNQQIENSLESAAQQAAERLRVNFQQTSMQLDQEMQERAAAMGTAMAESRTAAEGSLETLRVNLANETAQAQETLSQIRSASQGMEDWSARAAEISRSAQEELERRAAAVVEAESRQMASSVEEGVAAWKGRLEPALEMAGRQAIERLGGELERQLDSGLDRASRALEELQRGTLDSQATLRAHQETLSKMSTQEVENAVNRLLESVERLERDFGEAARAATAKWLAELETKSTETTHSTFESMFKTAEWYEKKVHNQVQATMDKGLEQAGGHLREKAGEISSLFATELDHYSRSYVEHAQGQLEETARDTLESVGKRSAELTTASAASFAQQTLNQTDATLADLRSQTGAIVEHLSAQMQARVEQVRKASDANLFKSAREFQAVVTQEKEQAIDGAKQELATQTAFARETLRLAGETLEKRLRQTVLSLSDESLEEYKKRLENASNSWLLATATKLNQQSEQHIESLAQSTEVRLRETCNEVFDGLGETLRRRMLDLFGPSAGESRSPESK